MRGLDEFLRSNVGPISYELECNDGSTLNPVDLADLVRFENPSFRRVQQITIKSTHRSEVNGNVRIRFRPGDLPFEGAARVTLEFDNHRICKSIEDELKDRIRLMRPWYSLLTMINFIVLLPVVFIVLAFAGSAATAFAKLQGYHAPIVQSPPPTFSDGESTAVMIVLFSFLGVVGFILNKLQSYFFPRVILLTGRQATDFAKAQRGLYFAFVVIGVGLVINVVAALLVK